ncbi:AraC-like DNA-binding protein [Cohnella sp. SGD-V74]|uniref:helix-turn-helix domain-containing protein n=1 Tax=unclassified Cohnella TaxID=2636738 RepID=UPI000D438C5C|nr:MULTISPECIES: AraC family transcriptional regulator [unclassified Cohnella]PRX74285.1 AraC-like DNA-binding protein [Cohnella sp. SGD-V74]
MREEIYSFRENAAGPFGLQFEMAGKSFCDGSYRIDRPRSAVSSIEYIIRGRGTVRIDSQEFYPKAGDTYFLHQGQDHLYFSDKDDPWIKIWVNVRGELLTDLIGRYGLKGCYHIPDFYAMNYLQRIVHNAQANDDNAVLNCTLAVHELLVKLNEHLYAPAVLSDAMRLKTYLDHRVSENVSLSELAAVIGKSESQTIRLFKREYGVTPYHYHLQLKLDFAQKLLRSTGMTVREVAAHLSFGDEFYFSNLFKKKLGSAPNHFRKMRL